MFRSNPVRGAGHFSWCAAYSRRAAATSETRRGELSVRTAFAFAMLHPLGVGRSVNNESEWATA